MASPVDTSVKFFSGEMVGQRGGAGCDSESTF